jgi:hypothetical protein
MAPAAKAAAAIQIQVGRCFIAASSSRVDRAIGDGDRNPGQWCSRRAVDDSAGGGAERASVTRADDLAAHNLGDGAALMGTHRRETANVITRLPGENDPLIGQHQAATLRDVGDGRQRRGRSGRSVGRSGVAADWGGGGGRRPSGDVPREAGSTGDRCDAGAGDDGAP